MTDWILDIQIDFFECLEYRERKNAPESRFYGCAKCPKCKGTREIVEVEKDRNQKIVSNLHKVVNRFR